MRGDGERILDTGGSQRFPMGRGEEPGGEGPERREEESRSTDQEIRSRNPSRQRRSLDHVRRPHLRTRRLASLADSAADVEQSSCFERLLIALDEIHPDGPATYSLDGDHADLCRRLRHLPTGETEPPTGQTHKRIMRFVDVELEGSGNVEVRALVRRAAELAEAVKHRGGATRRDAGIASDAVILLANILRRVGTAP